MPDFLIKIDSKVHWVKCDLTKKEKNSTKKYNLHDNMAFQEYLFEILPFE